jgi:hypothetical protein
VYTQHDRRSTSLASPTSDDNDDIDNNDDDDDDDDGRSTSVVEVFMPGIAPLPE